MLDVRKPALAEIVDCDHFVAALEEQIAEVRADESGSAYD